MVLLPVSLLCSRCPPVKPHGNIVPVISLTPSLHPSTSSLPLLTSSPSVPVPVPPPQASSLLHSPIPLSTTTPFSSHLPLPHLLFYLPLPFLTTTTPPSSTQHLPDLHSSPLFRPLSPPSSLLQSYLNLTHPSHFLSFPLLSILF